MSILSKRFSAEVAGPDGGKTEVSFTGQTALALIANAEVMGPIFARLCHAYEKPDLTPAGFDEELTGMAIAQAALKLFKEVTADEVLFSRGVTTFSASTQSLERMSELIFVRLAQLEPQSPEFLKRQAQLQLQERQLADHKEMLSIFRQLQAKQGQS